jgi:hypothetical protein
MTLSESEVELDWPTVSELKQTLDITTSDWDVTMTRQLAAAIAQVKIDVGLWDELTDTPDEALGQAAMRLAVLMRTNAETPVAGSLGAGALIPRLTQDPIYQNLLKGHRRRFAIA